MTQQITDAVRERYGAVALSGLSTGNAGISAVARAFGYSPEELASIPAEANMGLSCGNPTAWAGLREGETVVDLGCGGGLDVLLAAPRVGASGRAIGIDMTTEMIDLARRNAAGAGHTNVDFHQTTIDKLPLADASVDCVISNCVINLAPDKDAVLHEIARVLKPGGRLAISDIALKQTLPAEIGTDMLAYVGCVAGALRIDDYKAKLAAAGFEHVEIIDSGSDLNAYKAAVNEAVSSCQPTDSRQLPVAGSGCCSGPVPDRLTELMTRYNINDYAASVRVFAVNPQ